MFSITVSPANDAPIIAQAEDQTINEDTQGVFSFEVSDIDTGTTLNLSAISDTDAVSIEANSLDFSLTITPEDNWHGQTEITVFVSDGELSDTTFFLLIVDPINDSPIISDISDTTISENTSLHFDLVLTDVDTAEVFTIFATSDSPYMSVSASAEDSSIIAIPDEDLSLIHI